MYPGCRRRLRGGRHLRVREPVRRATTPIVLPRALSVRRATSSSTRSAARGSGPSRSRARRATRASRRRRASSDWGRRPGSSCRTSAPGSFPTATTSTPRPRPASSSATAHSGSRATPSSSRSGRATSSSRRHSSSTSTRPSATVVSSTRSTSALRVEQPDTIGRRRQPSSRARCSSFGPRVLRELEYPRLRSGTGPAGPRRSDHRGPRHSDDGVRRVPPRSRGRWPARPERRRSAGKADTSLFVAYGPTNFGNPEIAIAVVLEESGFGSAAAAPIVRDILEPIAVDRMPRARTFDEIDERQSDAAGEIAAADAVAESSEVAE